jgi:hypothetical protein
MNKKQTTIIIYHINCALKVKKNVFCYSTGLQPENQPN